MRVYKESLTIKYLYVFLHLTMVFGFATVHLETTLNDSNQQKLSKTITVDKSGKSDFSTIQSAIDWIPENNNEWIRIQVKSGVYREQVEIPPDKPFIVLEGESMNTTIIAWGDYDRLDRSPTFSCYADNFVLELNYNKPAVLHVHIWNLLVADMWVCCARQNTYNHPLDSTVNENPWKRVAATQIRGNRNSFYECGFYGLQDTLWDASGLHYFKSCFIEGADDFIFGSAQSIYEDCDISVISEWLSVMKKDDSKQFVVPRKPSAFVFKECRVFGTGKVYLGRAWRSHFIVLFYRFKLSNVVVPKGWDSWNYAAFPTLYGFTVTIIDKITYTEHKCFGQGSNKLQRVGWIKTLSRAMVDKLTSITFIDKEGWIKELP
ncbi:hypothetical protein MKX03_034067 [Papaver bracteatum]|nr:hypothetical protein MKX03_034067 [Papaver bracteatum]